MNPVADKKGWVERLRELPEEHKKGVLILVAIVAAIAILPFEVFFTAKNINKLSQSISSIDLSSLSLPSDTPPMPDLNASQATPDASGDDAQTDTAITQEDSASDVSPETSPDVFPETSPMQTPQQFWGGQ